MFSNVFNKALNSYKYGWNRESDPAEYR